MRKRQAIQILSLYFMSLAAMVVVGANSTVLAQEHLTDHGTVAMSSHMQGRNRSRMSSRRPCNETTEHIKTNLSTQSPYTGTIDYPEGGMTGESTLSISGDENDQQFTLTSGSTTRTGRLIAITTCHYTGITMMFDAPTSQSMPQPAAPPKRLIVSVRACKNGNNLVLTSVTPPPPAPPGFSFTTGGSALGGREEWGRCKSYR